MNDGQYVSDHVPWVDHIYSALKWTEGSVRRLHELLEHEQSNDDLRAKAVRALTHLETAKQEAFDAFEKMGFPGSDEEQTKRDVNALAEETKAKVLELDAAYLEAAVNSPEGRAGYESLRQVVLAVVAAMRHEAGKIGEKVKGKLKGPPKP